MKNTLNRLLMIGIILTLYGCSSLGIFSGSNKSVSEEKKIEEKIVKLKEEEKKEEEEVKKREIEQTKEEKIDLSELKKRLAVLEERAIRLRKEGIRAATEKERTLLEQIRREELAKKQMAKNYITTAQKLQMHGNLSQAKTNLLKALELDPNNKDAQMMLDRINEALGIHKVEPSKTLPNIVQSIRRIKEAKQAEIKAHFDKGTKLFREEKYKEALHEFEYVKQQFEISPYPLGLPEIEKNIQEWINQTNAKLEEVAKITERKQKEEAYRKALEYEKMRQKQQQETIQKLLDIAMKLVDEGKYSRAARTADEIIERVPNTKLAQIAEDIKDTCKKLKIDKDYKKILELKKWRWLDVRKNIQELLVPPEGLYLHDKLYPSAEKWERAKQRKERTLFKERKKKSRERLATENKLKSIRIKEISFTNPTLPDVVYVINEAIKSPITGQPEVQIIYDRTLPNLEDQIPTFSLADVTLENLLNMICKQFGVQYVVTDNGYVRIVSTKESEDTVFRIIAVKDLVAKTTQFAAPDIAIGPPAGEGEEALDFGGDLGSEDQTTPIEISSLEALIKMNIKPETWEDNGGFGSLRVNEELGLLFIKNTPEVIDGIQNLFDQLRSYTRIMVSIEARFLSTTDDFLQDVMTELRTNTQFTGNEIAAPGSIWDAATSSFVVGLTEGLGSNETQGAESWYDWRAISTFDPLSGAIGALTTTTSTRLRNQGGLALRYNIFSESEPLLNIVSRMIEKKQKATILNSPRLVAFNSQRAYVMLTTQRTYIKDYEIEVVGAERAYDPQIGVLQDGIILDVRPIVSNDKKYVTMENRIVWINVVALNSLIITSGVILQMPVVDIHRVYSTVRIPDRGTLIISGFKEAADISIKSKTPVLGDIPFIGLFFRRNYRSTEYQNVVLLITPTIIDLKEIEAETFH